MVSRLMWPFIVLQVAAVVAIVAFLRMLLHKQLERGMRRIKKLDEHNVRKETELSGRLDDFHSEYSKKIAEAEDRARVIVETAKEEARSMRDEERGKAKEEAKKIIEGANMHKERLVKEIDRSVLDKGVIFSGEILERLFSRGDFDALKESALREVLDLLSSSKEITGLVDKNDEFEIISPDPLSESHKRELARVLKAGSGRKVVKFSVDKTVLGGLILKAGEEIIDGSVAHRMRKAAQELRDNRGI